MSSLAFKNTESQTAYVLGFPHWPRILNYPPAASIAAKTLMKYATSSNPSPESFTKFKYFLESQKAAGCDTVEIVSREVFETAKSHLEALHWKLYHSIEVMQSSAHLTAFGGALIAIGAMGVHLTQPTRVVEPEAPKKNWTRIFSYGAMVTGLALIALATYCLQVNVNLLMENFEVVN